MTTAEILARLKESYPELLVADGFDEAILGVADGWFGRGHHEVVCYDYDRCVEILVAQGMSEENALEYLEFNMLGAYTGEFTPVFLYRWK